MRAVCVALAAASVSAEYFVHTRSLEHKRVAAWARTICGSPSSKPPSDIITQWGETVSPDPAPLLEYPRPQLTRESYVNL